MIRNNIMPGDIRLVKLLYDWKVYLTYRYNWKWEIGGGGGERTGKVKRGEGDERAAINPAKFKDKQTGLAEGQTLLDR